MATRAFFRIFTTMKKLIFIPILAVIFGCNKYNDEYCYTIDTIEVNGELMEVGKFRCGCYPNSIPQGKTEYKYKGIVYPIIKTFKCY